MKKGIDKMLRKLLFNMAKSPFMGKIVGNAFQYCSRIIPVKRVYDSKKIVAFHHPQPLYKNHLIISPKKAVRNLQQMASDGLSRYFVKIWETAKDICAMHPEFNDSFVMVANGGKRQEVQQVHFHMFTDHAFVNEYAAQEQFESVFYRDANICVLAHPTPNWEFHCVMKPVSPSQMAENEEYQNMYFRSLLHNIDALNAEFKIVQRGYSLVYQYSKQISDQKCPVFHIVSGKKVSA
ncbi:MAG: HIT domain-containing protein [Clostridia bacterium]|nr:HIT domain-containing protein [Clostridia bacterium]